MHELEGWAADHIFTGVEIHLDWRDRLRVLLGRTIYVDVMVDVENAPGRTFGTSHAWVARLSYPWTRQPGGYATENQR